MNTLTHLRPRRIGQLGRGQIVRLSPFHQQALGLKQEFLKRNKEQQIQLVIEIPFDVVGTVRDKGSYW